MANYETSLKIDAPMASVIPTFTRLAKSLEWKVESSDDDSVAVREPWSVAVWRSMPVSLEADVEGDSENRSRVFYRASMTGYGPVAAAVLKKTVTSFHEKLGMLVGDEALEEKADLRAEGRRKAAHWWLTGFLLWIGAILWMTLLVLADGPRVLVWLVLGALACGAWFMLRGWWRWLTN